MGKKPTKWIKIKASKVQNIIISVEAPKVNHNWDFLKKIVEEEKPEFKGYTYIDLVAGCCDDKLRLTEKNFPKKYRKCRCGKTYFIKLIEHEKENKLNKNSQKERMGRI